MAIGLYYSYLVTSPPWQFQHYMRVLFIYIILCIDFSGKTSFKLSAADHIKITRDGIYAAGSK